ncbi:MAG: beta-ketoacyl-[acyl-carrier-protein] synthase family protein, partial [Planctomycetota bacterium]
MKGRNVVVTGTGCVCASGVGEEELAERLRSGESGVGLEGDDRGEWRLGAEEISFEGKVSRLALRRLDGTMRKALHAALQAFDGAGVRGQSAPERTGVVVGTGFAGSLSSLGFIRSEWQDGPEGADPSLFPNTVPNGPAGQLAIQLKARGPSTNFFEAGVAGESALAFAGEEIREGRADVMLVCGVDERTEPLEALEKIYARARRETDASGALRPFDLNRSGGVFGDAAAVLTLEAEEHAAARGAPALAALGPVAVAAEATPPGRWPVLTEPYARAMREALSGVGIAPSALAFVNASACGSPEFDAFEASAIREVLGGLADSIPVTAPKGHTGDLSSSGVLRAVVTVLALAGGFVPATARLREPDPSLGIVTVGCAGSPLASPHVLQAGSGPGGCHAAFVLTG